MNRLKAWFSPTFFDLIWFVFFGHFFGYSKEETKAYFARKRQQESVDNFKDLLHNDGEEFE